MLSVWVWVSLRVLQGLAQPPESPVNQDRGQLLQMMIDLLILLGARAPVRLREPGPPA